MPNKEYNIENAPYAQFYNTPLRQPLDPISRPSADIQFFVSREEVNQVVNALVREISPAKVINIHGNSGGGKSTLAKKVLNDHKFVNYHTHFFIAFDGRSFAEQVIVEYRARTNDENFPEISPNVDILIQLKYCYNHWTKSNDQGIYPKVLFVWDNLVDDADISRYLPGLDHIQIIITSHKKISTDCAEINLSNLSLKQNLEVFEYFIPQKTQQDPRSATEIIEFVGCNTKAVSLVAEFLKDFDQDLSSFLSQIEKKKSFITHSAFSSEFGTSLTATLEVVYEFFEQKHKGKPYFIDFLLLLSLLSLQGFDWENILWPMVQNLDKTASEDDEDKWQNYYRQYKIWHWVETDNRLHQITREFLKSKLASYLNKVEIQKAFTSALVSITKTFKDPSLINKEDIANYSLFVPHLEEFSKICDQLLESKRQGLDNTDDYLLDISHITLSNYALNMFYLAQGQHDKAMEYGEKDVDISRQLFGDNHREYLVAVVNLADIYLQKSWYTDNEIPLLQKAKKYLEEVRQKRPQNSNWEKLEYIYTLGKLAVVYRDLGLFQNNSDYQSLAIEYHGDIKNALTELLRTIELDGPQHLIYQQIGGNYANLAEAYRHIKSYKKVKQNYDLALANTRQARELLQKENLNDQSYDNSLASSYFNFAKFYWNIYVEAETRGNTKAKKYLKRQDNYKQTAWGYAKEAMKLVQEVLGENHPQYQQTQNLIEQMKTAGWDRG